MLIEQGVTQDRATVLEQDNPVSEVGSDDCASEDFEGDPNEVVDLLPGIPACAPPDEELYVRTISSCTRIKVSETLSMRETHQWQLSAAPGRGSSTHVIPVRPMHARGLIQNRAIVLSGPHPSVASKRKGPPA